MGIGESIFLKATRNAGILARAEAETLFRRNLEAAQRAGELSRDQDPKSIAKCLNARYRLFADIQFTRTIIEGLVVRITTGPWTKKQGNELRKPKSPPF